MKEIIKALEENSISAISYDDDRVYFAGNMLRGIIKTDEGGEELAVVVMLPQNTDLKEILINDTLFRYCIRFPSQKDRAIINVAPLCNAGKLKPAEALKRCFFIAGNLFTGDEAQLVKAGSRKKRL